MQEVSLISHPSRSVAYYLRPDHIPRTFWRHRQLIGQLVRRSVAARYRGSVLGILWSVLLPLVMLVVYTFVFSVVLKARWGTEADTSKTYFALTLFCGLLLFNLFAETVSGATTAVVGNVSYVKRVVFPLEILPAVTLGSALFTALISFGILLLGLVVFGYGVPATAVYFPLTVLPLVLLCLGLGWFVASVGVYVRDVGPVVAVLMQILIFMTPIFYAVNNVPEAFRLFLWLNPLTIIVENARGTVMNGHPPSWMSLGIITALGLIVLQLGYVWFMKTKRGFADVV